MLEKCRGRLRRILFWRPDLRLAAVFYVWVLLLLLIPLIRLSFFAIPWYDDYMYGKFVKNFLDLDYSLKSALEGAVYCVKTNWYAWQGTFSSIFCMSLMPAVWGEEFYFAGPIFLILILPFSVCVFGKVMLSDVLKVNKAAGIVVISSVAAVCVVLIHDAHSGFFWYNAGIHYMGMHSFLLLLIAGWIRLLSDAGKVSSVLLVLWTLVGAALGAGANYVTALQGMLVGLSIAALCVALRNKRVLLLIPSLLVYGYGFYKNVAAPGNNVRRSLLQNAGLGMDALSSVLQSFWEAFRHLGEFTGLITVAVMLMLVPVIWIMVEKCTFRFRYPGGLLLWSVCLYAAGFTPGLYSLGGAGPERTLNAIKLTCQILLFVNEVYWLGWFHGKLERTGSFSLLGWKWDKKERLKVEEQRPSVLFFIVVGIGMLGIFAAEPNRMGVYSSYGAYCCVHTGEANNFYQEYLGRLEVLRSDETAPAFEPYSWTPCLLCHEDLSEDPWAGQNTAMSNWYDKESVRIFLKDTDGTH